MLINLAFNFGTIYDNLETLYFFFIDTPFSVGTTPSEAGNLIGDIIYMIYTPPVPVASKTPVAA